MANRTVKSFSNYMKQGGRSNPRKMRKERCGMRDALAESPGNPRTTREWGGHTSNTHRAHAHTHTSPSVHIIHTRLNASRPGSEDVARCHRHATTKSYHHGELFTATRRMHRILGLFSFFCLFFFHLLHHLPRHLRALSFDFHTRPIGRHLIVHFSEARLVGGSNPLGQEPTLHTRRQLGVCSLRGLFTGPSSFGRSPRRNSPRLGGWLTRSSHVNYRPSCEAKMGKTKTAAT
ncbi:hypothetical protein LZ30DRAFT_318257 [Colletotrichum cereale]|nr:hypothetical protein LZ30DRAFT_318257 [Colletotrichum cereale]